MIKKIFLIAASVISLTFACDTNHVFSGEYIVKDGKANAEIVTAEKPSRSTRLAALDLQEYIGKISGAKLPIVNAPTADDNVKIYLGSTKFAKDLGFEKTKLKYGAYRIKSGDKWLVIFGDDTDFVPQGPIAMSRGQLPAATAEWDKLTAKYSDVKWRNPVASRMYRYYNKTLDIWEGDRKGSMYAVCAFLEKLGVRWYMPGELGEIVPEMKSIPLQKIDEEVHPDFPLRFMYFAWYHSNSIESIKWQIRVGFNHGKETMGHATNSHGNRDVHGRDETKTTHPEFFAFWGGKRETTKKGLGEPCLSSKGLFEEQVKFARAVFDIYGDLCPGLSVMPQDGYATICQCELCKGKDTLDRGWYGSMSDYVWEFVNNAAKEIYKTNPDKLIHCSAYGTYLLPPLKIKKLSPNLISSISYSRLLLNNDMSIENYKKSVEGWLKITPSGKIKRGVHYLESRPSSANSSLPVYYPHTIDWDLKFLKGKSIGEFDEVSFDKDGGLHVPIFNHLNLYVTSRLFWDADLDVDKLLDEYYKDFYGPAAESMKAFVNYSEKSWVDMKTKADVLLKGIKMFDKVRAAVKPGTVYGKRIALLADYFAPMKGLHEKLLIGRKGVPEYEAHLRSAKEIKVDGNLDDEFWKHQRGYGLVNNQTGSAPFAGTHFQIGWGSDKAFYFGIRCDEPDMDNLKCAAEKDGDMNIWNGDCLELLIETQPHSYYQITISPDGYFVDLDRKGGLNTQWSSDIQVATYKGKDFWTVEARLPLTGDMKGSPDPLNGVAGGRPTKTYPFYFNVGRIRVRGDNREGSLYSPTGKGNFHNVMKFAKLYVK